MKFSFVRVSMNAKTSPMPVVTSSKDTCPKSCPLKKENGGGCYASVGRPLFTWNRLEKSGLNFNELLEQIKSIPSGRIWRMNVAGDLQHKNEQIDSKALESLTEANKGRKGFGYTHHNPTLKTNGRAIKKANDEGFTINLSADGLNEADRFVDLNIAPVVTILPSDQKTNLLTPKGNKVVICPAYTHNTQCIDCQLCQKKDRNVIVGFPAHSIMKKKVDKIFAMGN